MLRAIIIKNEKFVSNNASSIDEALVVSGNLHKLTIAKMASRGSLSSKSDSKKNILLCISGSVATIKIPELFVKLHKEYNVRMLCSSSSSLHFLSKSKAYNPKYYELFEQLGGFNLIVTDTEEWDLWNIKGDIVLHIELRKWADLILIG